jgi:DNA polymerase III subunit epsilon
MRLDFTALDVETANSGRGSICAVGLAKVRDGQIVRSMSWLVEPPGGRIFETMNTRRHGITAADLDAAIPWEESLTALLNFAEEDVFAHHSMFDMQALSQACELSALRAPILTSIDTQALAKSLLPIKNFGLKDVARALALPRFKHHDAEEDAVTCARILIELARSQGGLNQLLLSSPAAKEGAPETIRCLARASSELHPWIRKKIEENPYSAAEHNSWLDLVLRHPEGRAIEGTPCIECGSAIDKRTNFKFKDRHCCAKCADKLKKRAKRYAASLGQNL